MNIGFDNIYEHIIPISDFGRKWRLLDQNNLPDIHLNQLKPLDNCASKFLNNYISNTQLHKNVPFKKDFFRTVDSVKIYENNESEIKKWLYQRGLPFDKPVFLSWDQTDGMIVPWKLLIKYFDRFYYGCSDDLTVFDQSLNWALLFYHEDEIYFGTNNDFVPDQPFSAFEYI